MTPAARLELQCLVLWVDHDEFDLCVVFLEIEVKHLLVQCCAYHVGYVITIPELLSEAASCIKQQETRKCALH